MFQEIFIFFGNKHVLSSANKNISAYFLFNGRYLRIIKKTLAQEPSLIFLQEAIYLFLAKHRLLSLGDITKIVGSTVNMT
jgi:hypothetical protein